MDAQPKRDPSTTSVIDVVAILRDEKYETFETPSNARRRARLLHKAGFQVSVSNCTVTIHNVANRQLPMQGYIPPTSRCRYCGK